VRYVVNSHWHADHTHGNQAFTDAQLIGSANTRRDVMQIDLPSLNRSLSITRTQLQQLRQGSKKQSDDALEKRSREQIKAREDYLQNISQLKILAPFVVLDDNLTIQEGKQEARLLYLGAGHTDGDIILFLPAEKIAFVGDLFFNKALPNVQDASILQWMKTLEKLLQLNAERFIPGHGPAGIKREVESFLRYFEELKSLVEPAVDRGDSLEQVTRELQVPEKYASYQFQNFFPSNVQKMYSEIKALQLARTPAEDASKTDPKQPLRQR
jgi:cyclase